MDEYEGTGAGVKQKDVVEDGGMLREGDEESPSTRAKDNTKTTPTLPGSLRQHDNTWGKMTTTTNTSQDINTADTTEGSTRQHARHHHHHHTTPPHSHINTLHSSP
ncbi:hypothetical protein Pmani_011619 [Petrolisthes manimaculis]|uniref:Uncharacterized protein n=1 Tax=Petrolisthes manimaculis TaxID=1843537 RepID=A0AAE1Q0S2_9EUCA|nr:hypothetical protein Pmani_011619 [Petrolisthes manimaculis]